MWHKLDISPIYKTNIIQWKQFLVSCSAFKQNFYLFDTANSYTYYALTRVVVAAAFVIDELPSDLFISLLFSQYFLLIYLTSSLNLSLFLPFCFSLTRIHRTVFDLFTWYGAITRTKTPLTNKISPFIFRRNTFHTLCAMDTYRVTTVLQHTL